jgi:hypothetical protein
VPTPGSGSRRLAGLLLVLACLAPGPWQAARPSRAAADGIVRQVAIFDDDDRRTAARTGNLNLGPFLEGGWGSYHIPVAGDFRAALQRFAR